MSYSDQDTESAGVPSSRGGSRKRADRPLMIDIQGGAIVPSCLSAYRAGFTAVVVSVGLPPAGFEQTLKDMYRYFTYFEALGDRLVQVLNAEDIAQAGRTGRLGVLFGLQGAGAIGDVPH